MSTNLSQKLMLLAGSVTMLAIISGCTTSTLPTLTPTSTPVTSNQTTVAKEAADDLVVTPSGMEYRANVHEAGVTNPWPEVQTTNVNLSDNISVDYRSYIETQAGETRNNIVFVRVTPIPSSQFPNVGLTANNVTAGIEINQSSGGGFPGNTKVVLTINILNNVKLGEYTFDIDLVIDGEDYGQLPCTINVTY